MRNYFKFGNICFLMFWSALNIYANVYVFHDMMACIGVEILLFFIWIGLLPFELFFESLEKKLLSNHHWLNGMRVIHKSKINIFSSVILFYYLLNDLSHHRFIGAVFVVSLYLVTILIPIERNYHMIYYICREKYKLSFWEYVIRLGYYIMREAIPYVLFVIFMNVLEFVFIFMF